MTKEKMIIIVGSMLLTATLIFAVTFIVDRNNNEGRIVKTTLPENNAETNDDVALLTKNELRGLCEEFELGKMTRDVFVEKTSNCLNTYDACVKTQMGEIYNSVVLRYGNQEFLEKVKNDGDNKYNSMVAEQDELMKQFESNNISCADFVDRLTKNIDELSKLVSE